jgi:hypothetical protein
VHVVALCARDLRDRAHVQHEEHVAARIEFEVPGVAGRVELDRLKLAGARRIVRDVEHRDVVASGVA